MAQGSPDFRYSILCIHYSLLPLITFDRRYTYLLSRILIVCTSSLCRCLTVSYTPIHPLALLFLCKPGQIDNDSQDADNALSCTPIVFVVVALCILRRLNVLYIFLALPRDAPEMQSGKHTAMHTRTYSHSCSTPTGTSTTTGREIRFSPSARASKRRYDGDDACAPPPIHPFPPGHFRGAFEAATLLSQCPVVEHRRHGESAHTLAAAKARRFRSCLTR